MLLQRQYLVRHTARKPRLRALLLSPALLESRPPVRLVPCCALSRAPFRMWFVPRHSSATPSAPLPKPSVTACSRARGQLRLELRLEPAQGDAAPAGFRT